MSSHVARLLLPSRLYRTRTNQPLQFQSVHSSSSHSTHSIENQATDFENFNAATDPAITEGLTHYQCPPSAKAHIHQFGTSCGSTAYSSLSNHANTYTPVLQTHTRTGQRIDSVQYQSSYHDLLQLGVSNGATAYAWQNPTEQSAHVTRGTLLYLLYQLDPGICCPITMTFASVPALKHENSTQWIPHVTTNHYDPRDCPVHRKTGAMIGMSMTEKQGGSDVRANTTFATPINDHDQDHAYTLLGHKWFTSAPCSDAFLTLAQTNHGLSCFLVPRWCHNGDKNHGFQIMRLKDKLGDRSNASSEVEYRNAVGYMVGTPGRGISTILDMVVHTRLDCVIGSSALMRHAVHQAVHFTSQRKAFGKVLSQQPVMTSVLVDMAIDSEAAIVTWMRLTHAFDNSPKSTQEQQFARIATAVAKYWICKRAPMLVCEAMECFGGNGYVEEGPMPRLFRQSPLNSIWEGSANVISMDILRALQTPGMPELFISELELARGFNIYLDQMIDTVKDHLSSTDTYGSRCVADTMALTLQGSLLVRFGNTTVADAFCKLRLGNSDAIGWNYGAWGKAVISSHAQKVILERAMLG